MVLNASRIIRLTKFLADAAGMDRLLTIIPSRATPYSFFRRWIANQGLVRLGARNACSKSLRCFIRRREGRLYPTLGGKTCAAFGSAGCNHCATPFGFHTNQKSMGAFSFSNRWLVCAFHVGVPLNGFENPALQ